MPGALMAPLLSQIHEVPAITGAAKARSRLPDSPMIPIQSSIHNTTSTNRKFPLSERKATSKTPASKVIARASFEMSEDKIVIAPSPKREKTSAKYNTMLLFKTRAASGTAADTGARDEKDESESNRTTASSLSIRHDMASADNEPQPPHGVPFSDIIEDTVVTEATLESVDANTSSTPSFVHIVSPVHGQLPPSRTINSNRDLQYDIHNGLASETPDGREVREVLPRALSACLNINPQPGAKIEPESKTLATKLADQLLLAGDDSITIKVGDMCRMLKRSNPEYLRFISNYYLETIESGRILLRESNFDIDQTIQSLIILIMKIQGAGMNESATRRGFKRMVGNIREALQTAGFTTIATKELTHKPQTHTSISSQKETPEARGTSGSKPSVASKLNSAAGEDGEDTMLAYHNRPSARGTNVNSFCGPNKNQEEERTIEESSGASSNSAPKTSKYRVSREPSPDPFVSPNGLEDSDEIRSAAPSCQKRKVTSTELESSHLGNKKKRTSAGRAKLNTKSASKIIEPQTYLKKSQHRPFTREDYYAWPEIDLGHVIEDGKKRAKKEVNYNDKTEYEDYEIK